MLKQNLNRTSHFTHPTSNKGITIIALIITIIIMLILVVVTISTAINGGLFEKAGEAVGKTQNAINQEQQMINDIKEEFFGNSTGGGNGGNTGGETEKVPLPLGIRVGDYVNYTPDTGTYTVASGTIGSGYTSNQTFTTEVDDADAGTSALKWRVLSINEETGKVELVSETAAQSSTKLYLQGADGYNHGVDILNDLCESLYSKTVNGRKVATGRSINVEDINAKTTYDYTTHTNYGQVYTYSNKQYPIIYAKELGSTENGLNETTTLLNGSEGVERGTLYETGVTGYSTYTGSARASTLYTTHTDYYYSAEGNLNTTLGIHTAPKGLLVLSKAYWLATRRVDATRGIIHFGMRYVASSGTVDRYPLFYSDGDSNAPGFPCRPVVTLKSNFKLSIDTENTTDSVTYWNVEFF